MSDVAHGSPRREGAWRRVLVVEDELIIALEIEDALRRAGYAVVGLVSTVQEAERLAREEPLDAVVLDVSLHGGRAFPIADALAARVVPFVFVTAYSREALPERFRDRPFVAKPHSDATLLEVLAEALRARAAGV
jgi:CheY-like chemotaxis protein